MYTQQRSLKRSNEQLGTFLTGFTFGTAGFLALISPELVYSLIFDAAFVLALTNGLFFLYRTRKNFGFSTIALGLLSLVLAGILFFYRDLPEWIIRVSFGWYCLLVGLVVFLQQGIYLYNSYKISWLYLLLGLVYIWMAFWLLFTNSVNSLTLMRLFGLYFLMLGFRYGVDAFNMESKDYNWKRAFHLSLPIIISAGIPDWTLHNFNQFIEKNSRPKQITNGRSGLLQVMVHVGSKGFQKVGHFTFSYKGIVYSYGNYDTSTERLKGLIGDGVFFCVPKDLYLENICSIEQNTIFEYDIALNQAQQEKIESLLKDLQNNSYRWYCRIERNLNFYHWKRFQDDYPSRLHMRTGAKFFKIKRGRFKTYYLFGDNCVLFADRILGLVGADVLSIRGIVSPGTVFSYLQQEARKEHSPVVMKEVHPCTFESNEL